MLVWRVADPVDGRRFLSERKLLAQRVAQPGLLARVAVQFAEILRHALAAGVVPGAAADPIARVDRARSLRTQVRVPGRAPSACRRRKRLAMGIGAGQAAEVRAV